jgi:hypothetical protein
VLRVGFASIAVLALAFAPKACVKKPPPEPPIDAPLPPPIPITSATTPPIWAPPTAATPDDTSSSSGAVPSASPELVKARQANDAKDFKKVRSILEKKVRGGKCAPEESQLLFRACAQLKDKACTEAVRAKHPGDVSTE